MGSKKKKSLVFLIFFVPVKTAAAARYDFSFVGGCNFKKIPSCSTGVATGNPLLPSDLCWCDGTSGCEQRDVWVYCVDMNSTEISSSNTGESREQTPFYYSQTPTENWANTKCAWGNADFLSLHLGSGCLEVKSNMETALRFPNKQTEQSAAGK